MPKLVPKYSLKFLVFLGGPKFKVRKPLLIDENVFKKLQIISLLHDKIID